jgi:hypothetical protein
MKIDQDKDSLRKEPTTFPPMAMAIYARLKLVYIN